MVRRPPLAKRLAARLLQERRERGWTQEEVAERTGIAPRHYQKLERAEINVTLVTLERLSDAFGVDPSELLSPVRTH